jgi:hypothetical protein
LDLPGYYKYWSNGVDRIDFVGTEGHPRDFDSSIFAGYLKGGKSYDSTGTEVDSDISDDSAPQITEFTELVTLTTPISGGVALRHQWPIDVMRYPDGSVVVLWSGRTGSSSSDDPDLRFAYSRFSAGIWTNTYLGKAGHKLIPDEQDYTGLGALHPNDPRIIYISTTIDPRDGSTAYNHHEIFMGVTCDGGVSFTWTPITLNSTADNLRPVVPAWNSSNMALLWLRGLYTTAQVFNEKLVGIVTQQ